MLKALIISLLHLSPATSHAVAPTPAMYKAMEIIDARGTKLPLEAPLVDGLGRERSIGDWMNQRAPLVLTFNYMKCPMLCGIQQDGLIRAINELTLRPGKDFHIVTVSIDPGESNKSIRQASERMSAQINADWVVLRGTEDSVAALTEASGFQYQWVEAAQEFAHPAATYIVTEQGAISQYFTSVTPQSRDLSLAILEAGNGQIGSIIDQITLSCLQYDLGSNSYVARDVMQAGGVAVMGGLVVFFAMMWRRERNRWR